MEETTQSADNSASDVEPVDAIADLLGDSSGETKEPQNNSEPEEVEEEEDIQEDDTEDSTDNDEDEVDSEVEEEDLAAMLGVKDDQISVTDDGDFMINVSVDGKKSNVKIKELIDGFQFSKATTNKSKELAAHRKEFEQQVAYQKQEINALMQKNQGMAQVLEQELLAEYQAVDWEDLRQYDPAEFSAKKHDYATKYQMINRMQAELNEQSQAQSQEVQAQQNTQSQAYLTEQYEVMLNNNPSWRNQDTFKKDMGELRNFVSDTYHFEANELDNVSDSRLIEVIKDAQAYRKGKTYASKRKKIVPKYTKSSNKGKAKKVSKLDRLTKLAKGAKGSNARDTQRDAVAELLLGG